VVEFLQGLEGVLVVDDYAAYGTAAKVLGSAVRVATCWAHIRRALLEAEVSYLETTEAIALIGEMFLVEQDLPN
jgi:transposase